MRLRLVRLWTCLARSVFSRRSPTALPAPRGPERLEDRVALSGLPVSAAPAGCLCPFCAGGALAVDSSSGEAFVTAARWPQPGGRGAPVTITYSYSNLLDGRLGGGMPAATLRAAIQEALGRWAAVAPLRFVEVRDSGPAPSAADYGADGKPMIRFGHRPIDGGWGVLAYGYYPGGTGLAGDIQLDTGERWSVHPAHGIDLIEVATHEIGHALGLAHSQAAQAIMAPMYVGRFAGPGTSYIFPDDVQGIRSLYGAGTGSVTPLSGVAPSPNQRFRVVGSTLYVQGTTGNDLFVFSGGAVPTVRLNGVAYTGDLTEVRDILFAGGAGLDRVVATGTAEAESFVLRPGRLVMTGPIWNVTAVNSEQIEVHGETGDQATLIDSPSNDTLIVNSLRARLVNAGFELSAWGFTTVTVAANAGGRDTARLVGRGGDDTLDAGPRRATLTGLDYAVSVRGFADITVVGNGGIDSAKLADSVGNDILVCRPEYLLLRAATGAYVVRAEGFATVAANATVGTDTVRLVGTAGKDTLIGSPTFSMLSGASYEWQVSNFDQVYAFGSGGSDAAFLYDSAGNDLLGSAGTTATLYFPVAFVRFDRFTNVVLDGTTGGVNRRPASPLAFTAEWIGSWV